MTTTTKLSSTLLVLLPLLSASACTAILDKDEADDGVQRCDNVDDCDEPDDNRFVAACVYGEGQDESSQKVCIVVYQDVPCDPAAYDPSGVYQTSYEQAQNSSGYIGCDGALGQIGCPPGAQGCDDGLSENYRGSCDLPDADIPAVAVTSELRGQDVLDQFCRHRFCNDSFVCDTSGSKWICRDCTDDDDGDDGGFGAGGCGNLYAGPDELSSVYIPQPEPEPEDCGARTPDDGDQFGPVP